MLGHQQQCLDLSVLDLLWLEVHAVLDRMGSIFDHIHLLVVALSGIDLTSVKSLDVSDPCALGSCDMC